MKISHGMLLSLRVMLKKVNLEAMVKEQNPDIICLQETKAEEHEVKML